MRIIDAHTHVFESLAGFGPRGELRGIGEGKARWANGDVIEMIPPELGDRSFTPDVLAALLRKHGVEKAVLLQGSFYGFQNDYTWEAYQKYPDLFLPSATFDPFCARADELADRYINQLHVPVVKFETSSGGGLMGYHKPFAIDADAFQEIFPMVEAAGATLVLDLGSPGMASFQPEAVANIARAYPSMRIVVCHLLAPGLCDAVPLERALRLLTLPNVWFDLAAIPWNVYPECYPYPTGQKYIRMAKKIVGSEKLIWGSDVPSPLTQESYSRLISYITDADIFTASELDGVLYGNAMDVYHF